ncbi:hypothetical protein [Ferrimicrobium sp.]|uniref:hypothetical protein n=1 Tax=Ferrimicrobium sp. TaxID=2926050 RepID=UPI0026328EAB|nr:hypothetical protein [Ferrimicrobium sp.]
MTLRLGAVPVGMKGRRVHFLRKHWWIGLAVLLALGTVAVIDVSGNPSLGHFYPAVGATVLVEAHGQGSEIVPVSSQMVPGPATSSQSPGFERYLPDSKVTLSANCTGKTQHLKIRLEPGNESLQPMCYPSGGGAIVVDGPYKFPYPKRVIVVAPMDVRWDLIVVEPGTMDSGVAVTG